MDNPTRKALEASIRHWQRMRDGKRRKMVIPGCTYCKPALEIPQADHCALCRKFDSNGCVGCPVRRETGHSFCRDTPFLTAFIAYNKHGATSPKFHAAAAKEVAFLESLREGLDT